MSLLFTRTMSLFVGTMTSLWCVFFLSAVTLCYASRRTDAAKQAAMTSFTPLYDALKRCDADTIANCTRFADTPACSCDWQTCRLYADCCKTLPALGANQTIPSGQRNMKKVVSCLNLHRLHSAEFNETWDRDVHVVNRCPSTGSDEHLASLCMMGSDEGSDAFFRLPVYGRRSLAFYMNVYCAACNGDRNVSYLKVEKICSSKEMDECESLIQAPNNLYVKKCIANVIDTCPANFTDKRTTRKCAVEENTTLYRYQLQRVTLGRDPRERVYRNRHCAICNQVPELPPLNCTSALPPGDKQRPQDRGIPPFSVLLDLNTGYKIEQDNEDAMQINRVQLQQCAAGHIFDPFNNDCRLLFCPPGSRLIDASCVREASEENVDEGAPTIDNIVNNNNKSNGATDLSCPLLRLNESEYDVIENGSILLRRSSASSTSGGLVVYRRDEYRIYDDVAYICSPFFDAQYNVTLNATLVVRMFEYDVIQSLLSVLGSTISLSALAVQFVVYMLLPALRNTPGKCVICLIVSLFVGQLLYLCVGLHGNYGDDDEQLNGVKPLETLSGTLCLVRAVVMHYAFLASFCWMNVLAIDIWRTFGSSQVSQTANSSGSNSSSCSFYVYSLYAWGIPLVIVLSACAIDILPVDAYLIYYRPLYGHQYCWIANPIALIAYFVVPLGILWLANVVMYAISAYHIYRASEASRLASTSNNTGYSGLLILYIKLSSVMGLTWGFGFVAAFGNWTVAWYLYIVFNTLQGALICCSFVCTRRTFQLLTEKYGRKYKNKGTRRLTEATLCTSRTQTTSVSTGIHLRT